MDGCKPHSRQVTTRCDKVMDAKKVSDSMCLALLHVLRKEKVEDLVEHFKTIEHFTINQCSIQSLDVFTATSADAIDWHEKYKHMSMKTSTALSFPLTHDQEEVRRRVYFGYNCSMHSKASTLCVFTRRVNVDG